MPNTVKRNYPYPALQGEPPNIPLALENLANAIETDLENVTAQIPAGTVNELESRAALMEGRLTNLERHQVRTGQQTQSSSGGDVTFTVPASTFAYGITHLSCNSYGGNEFSGDVSVGLNGTTLNVWQGRYSRIDRYTVTVFYAYYA